MKVQYATTTFVEIEIDAEKITEEFLGDFSATFFDVFSIGDLLDHLAQLWARGMVDNDTKFIEGFGAPAEFGIKFKPSSVVDSPVENEELI